MLTKKTLFIIFCAVLMTLAGYVPSNASEGMPMQISSTTIAPGGKIPDNYTCKGEGISPDISWKFVSEKAKSLAMIMEDPDAPSAIWMHWVIYNIPATTPGLLANIPATESLDNGTLQGRNSFGKIGYGGPCPPPGGGPHRYFFRIYALDAPLNLKSGSTAEEVRAAMGNHILEQAELMGRFER
jgi:Raf kinase inhibitor-like YbhB/YbcL family protein